MIEGGCGYAAPMHADLRKAGFTLVELITPLRPPDFEGRDISKEKQRRSGFTLVELIIVIAIIAIVAAVAFIAIDPARRLGGARNAKRRGDVRAIHDALGQLLADDQPLPSGITTTLTMLGTAPSGCVTPCGVGIASTTVVLPPVADSFIDQFSPTANNGGSTQIQEYPWTPANTRRGLIKFDFSSIPMNATIVSAQLFLKEATTYGSTRTVALHRITASWTEAGVTWNVRDGSSAWNSTGGDFQATATATASAVWTGTLDWDVWNVLPDVQAFVNGTQVNEGWLIKDNSEDASQAYWFFAARESADDPYLEVVYAAESTADACVNLTPELVQGGRIGSIPRDPRTGSAGQTYYAVRKGTAPGSVLVRACSAEQGETIEVEG